MNKKDTDVNGNICTLHNYARFGRDFWDWFTEHYSNQEFVFDEDSEKVMEIAEEHGLVKRVTYDPNVHGDIAEVSKGDKIWYWGDGE